MANAGSQFTDEQLEQMAEDYAQLIRDGWPLPTDKQANAQGRQSVTSALAIKWGLQTNRTVRTRIRKIYRAGYGHIIDKAVGVRQAEVDAKVAETKPVTVTERVDEHRKDVELKKLRAENRDLKNELAKQGDFVSAISGLADPLEPVNFQKSGKSSRNAETEMLVLSDLQWGETIDLAVMDGLNSYDDKIAANRLKRIFTKFRDRLTAHWPKSSPPPERIIIVLGGDMISGEIHEELSKTNTLLSIPAVRDCAAHICAGIRYLREILKCPIDIISVPGNHGRNTHKPESKLYAANSYDTLVADVVEMEFKSNGRWPAWFRMYKPYSGDALIWIYGMRVLITHGDRIGSRGGSGFIGSAATVARGFKKIVMDYAGRGIVIDFIICGHFHTELQLEEGICNGCLPGPSEYSRDLRFRPKPCSQAMVGFHPRHGITQIYWLRPGLPEEGTLYIPKKPPPPEEAKPRFRIPAIGERS